MKRKRYTHQQIISILKEHEAGRSASWRIGMMSSRTRSIAGSRSPIAATTNDAPVVWWALTPSVFTKKVS